MKRNLFAFSSAVMLLLWMAAAVMWVVSYAAPGNAHYFWPQERIADSVSNAATTSVAYSKGRIGFGGLCVGRSGSNNLAKLEAEFLLPDRFAQGTNLWNQLGFSYRSGPEGYNWGMSFPIWLVSVLAAPLPAMWLRWKMRRRKLRSRRGDGLCLACGYDLRGSDDRCPECGKPFLSRNRPAAVWVSWAFGLAAGQAKESERGKNRPRI